MVCRVIEVLLFSWNFILKLISWNHRRLDNYLEPVKKYKTVICMLYSHDQLYKHICLQNHNDDTIRRATQFLEKYTSHFIWKGCVWEGVGDRTELQHIDPHSYGYNSVSFPFSWAAQPGAWGPTLLCAAFLYRTLSPTRLIPNW